MSVIKAISPEDFYGEIHLGENKIDEIIKENGFREEQSPKFMNRLLGPSTTWKIFKKQQDAIECCLLRRNGLMPFAFEDVNGRRMFLSAHPKVFWALNRHRFFKSCNSYEVIREFAACKLYFDIEFEFEYNKCKDGERMLRSVLAVVCCNLKKFLNVSCGENDILDLDSSSDSKFSHHVIFEIQNVAFQDNYAVGSFVRRMCDELKDAFENSTKLHEIGQKYNIPPNDILELFIRDRKGQYKLFIDEGVYTKNRHFRLLGSSKQAKGIPLKVARNNKYKPGTLDLLDYFLDSLVTYFSWDVERVLEFDDSERIIPRRMHGKQSQPIGIGNENENESPYPQIDSFINGLISPSGWIRRKVFFSDSSTIVYDIQGFRYCSNIGREHKSNNIKYVVNLDSLGFYQKCHDPDCSGFRSNMRRLPEEICFFFENDKLLTETIQEFSEEEFAKAVEEMKSENNFELSVPDEELERVADCAESILALDW